MRVRNLQDAPPTEGTSAAPGAPTTLAGTPEISINEQSYVLVGTDPYPEDKPKPTIMDDPNVGPQNPDLPPPEPTGPKTIRESMLGFLMEVPEAPARAPPVHQRPPAPVAPAPAPVEQPHDDIVVIDPLVSPWAAYQEIPPTPPTRVGHYQTPMIPGNLWLGGV